VGPIVKCHAPLKKIWIELDGTTKHPVQYESSEDTNVNSRVAKRFDGIVYFGTVVEMWTDPSAGMNWWHVEYDDGDSEDVTQSELSKMKVMYDDQENGRG
jgi:hypothetical protein